MENEPSLGPPRPSVQDDLVRLCCELNSCGARYLVVGGFAVIQHGFLRATEDIDLLVPKLLLRMKQTYREKDALDREFLEKKLRGEI